MKNYEVLSKRLKTIRENCNKTQSQFARALGVSRNTVCNYENGITTPPIEVLRDYCKLGKVSLDYLTDTENDTIEHELISLVTSLPANAQNTLREFLKSLP